MTKDQAIEIATLATTTLPHVEAALCKWGSGYGLTLQMHLERPRRRPRTFALTAGSRDDALTILAMWRELVVIEEQP